MLGFEAFDAQMSFIALMLTAPLPAAILGGVLGDAWGGYKGEGMPNALTLCISLIIWKVRIKIKHHLWYLFHRIFPPALHHLRLDAFPYLYVGLFLLWSCYFADNFRNYCGQRSQVCPELSFCSLLRVQQYLGTRFGTNCLWLHHGAIQKQERGNDQRIYTAICRWNTSCGIVCLG